jgi:hypothetical protein
MSLFVNEEFYHHALPGQQSRASAAETQEAWMRVSQVMHIGY